MLLGFALMISLIHRRNSAPAISSNDYAEFIVIVSAPASSTANGAKKAPSLMNQPQHLCK